MSHFNAMSYFFQPTQPLLLLSNIPHTYPLHVCPLHAGSPKIPYVSFMGTTLANHSYVNLTLVGNALDGSDSVQCHTDLLTCCNQNSGAHRGDWYFPKGERLPYNGDGVDIYEFRSAQQVDLRRRNNADIPGIYRCTVETNAVHDDKGRETVYVGLYASGGECTHMCM